MEMAEPLSYLSGVFLALILTLGVASPFLFKQAIKALVAEEVEKRKVAISTNAALFSRHIQARNETSSAVATQFWSAYSSLYDTARRICDSRSISTDDTDKDEVLFHQQATALIEQFDRNEPFFDHELARAFGTVRHTLSSLDTSKTARETIAIRESLVIAIREYFSPQIDSFLP